MKAIYLLFFIFIFSFGAYAQASLKLLENNISPTLNAAEKAYKDKDIETALSLYKQFIYEQEIYNEELLAKDSSYLSKRNSDDEWTDWIHLCHNYIIIYRESDLREEKKDLLNLGLEICKKHKGENHLLYAHLLTLIPYFTEVPEDIEHAHLNAIRIFEEQLGNQHIVYADEVSRLAHFYLEKRETTKAEPLLTEIKPIFENHYEKDNRDYLGLLFDLTLVYLYLNNIEKSKQYTLQIKQILENTKNNDASSLLAHIPGLLRILERLDNASISDLHTFMGAETMSDDYLREIKEHFGEFSNQYINNLITTADDAFKNNKIERADSLYKIALEAEGKANSKNTPRYMEILEAIHANTTKEGRTKKLKNILNEKIYEHGAYSDEVKNLYLALYKNFPDHLDSAAYYLSTFQQTLVKQAGSEIHFFTEGEREMWWKKVNMYMITLKKLSFRYLTPTDNSSFLGYTYNGELFTKGTLLTSSQKLRQSVFSSNDTTLINEWNKLAALKKENIKTNEEQISRLERSVMDKSSMYREEQKYFNIEWQHIKEILEPGEVTIEFIVFNLQGKNGFEDHYLALMIRADMDYPEIVWTARESGIVEAMQSENKDALYDILWPPIEQYLEDNDIIYIAPTGLLHSVSFGGLQYGNGKYYLCEDYTFHNLLSTKDIIKLKNQKENISQSKQIALFGGADYSIPMNELTHKDTDLKNGGKNNLYRSLLDAMNPLRGPGFTYLPGSKKEVQQIRQYLSGLNWKSSLFMDKEATETRLKSLSSSESPEVIHISTHGFYFPQPKQELFNNNNLLPVNNENNNIYRLSDNPLMRSGLAFAGANHVWKGNDPIDGIDDGILTAYEISNLNLFNTELVVLSACNTGLGDIDHSEGVYGLQRAFRLAGVQTMIVSLWEVPDKETVELMTEFYSLWGKGLTKKEAFDKAQLKMRYTYPDQPEKWAGFVMIE